MSLIDSFIQGYQGGMDLQYGKKEREAKYQQGLADLTMKQAEADNAPRYYGSRADLMSNDAGLAGVKLQYAPQQAQADTALTRAQINHLNSMANGGGTGGMSTAFGKLFEDRARAAAIFGPDSPEVQAMDANINKEAGLTGGLGNYSGGAYFDPATGQFIATPSAPARSRDLRAVAGAENLKDYVGTAMQKLPQFQTLWGKAGEKLQGLSNVVLGTNFDAPSQLTEGNAAVTSAAEGFINTFGLNSTGENVNKAVKIFTPSFGESKDGYRNRVNRQLGELLRVQQRAKNRLTGQIPTGYTPANKAEEAKNELSATQSPNSEQLQAMAQDAIAKGADPKAVQAKMQQLMQGGG